MESKSDVLYVRLRRVGPNQQKPGRYTIGQVTFEYDHHGWYEVSQEFGEGLRRKRANELNRKRSLPLFDVMTYEEVLNLERAERAAAEAERTRNDKLFAGERVSNAIPMGAMKARRVGSLLDSVGVGVASAALPQRGRVVADEAPPRRVDRVEDLPVQMRPSDSEEWDDNGSEEGTGVTLEGPPAALPQPSPSQPSAPARRTPPRVADGRRLRQGGTSGQG